MKIETTTIEGLLVIKPTVFEDERGYFFESFNKAAFAGHGIKVDFVQDNQSLSQKDVLRGLHFQNPPHAQGKLVRVLNGSVLDVVVDIRKHSKTYGQNVKVIFSAKEKNTLYIPTGFAHGFLTLENDTVFSYKCTNYYNKASEDSLLWDDRDLAIDWGISDPLLSEKDKNGKAFRSFTSLF